MTFSLVEHHALLPRFKFITWRYCQNVTNSKVAYICMNQSRALLLDSPSYGCVRQWNQNYELGEVLGRYINTLAIRLLNFKYAKAQTKKQISLWQLYYSVQTDLSRWGETIEPEWAHYFAFFCSIAARNFLDIMIVKVSSSNTFVDWVKARID